MQTLDSRQAFLNPLRQRKHGDGVAQAVGVASSQGWLSSILNSDGQIFLDAFDNLHIALP
eukprot:2212116-Amphidinium_carterae.1